MQEGPSDTDPEASANAARTRGSLLGLACGDALARPVDGLGRAGVRDRYGRVTELYGGDGRPAGSLTAVSETALAVARALAEGNADPTPPETPREVLHGSVPFGLVEGDRRERAAAVATWAADADGDRATREAGVVLATVVGELVAGDGRDEALATARELALERDVPVELRETLSVVGDPVAASRSPAGPDDATGVLEAGLHDAVAADDPEEALVSAASLGGPACAVASVAGAIAGAHAGEDAIPARWLNGLEQVEDVRDLADRLADARNSAGSGE